MKSEFIKKKDSFLCHLKVTFQLFFTKKVKSIFLCLLNLITMTLVSFSIITLRYEETSSLIDLLYKEKISNVILTSKNEMKIGQYPTAEWTSRFTEDQWKMLQTFFSKKIYTPVYYGVTGSALNAADSFLYYRNVTSDAYKKIDMNAYQHLYIGPFNGIIELDEVSLSHYGFELDSRIENVSNCHLPVKDDELAISSFKADMFLEYGYREDDGSEIKLNSIDELIGKKMDGYRITAIYDMKEDLSGLKKLAHYDKNDPQVKLLNKIYYNCTFLSNYVIMRQGLLQETVGLHTTRRLEYVYRLPEDPSEMKEMVKCLTYVKRAKDKTLYYNVKINSPVSGYTIMVENQRFSPEHITLLITALFFLLSDIILLSIFFKHLFSMKNLSFLENNPSSTNLNIKSLPLFSSLLFFLIALLLSILPTWICCILFNLQFFNTFLLYDFVSSLLVIAACIILSLVCVVPTYLSLKKQK